MVLVAAGFAALYVIGMSAEPYRTSTRYINENAAVRGVLGAVESTRLSFFGYRFRYEGTSGNAEYTLHVVGQKGTGTAYLILVRAAGLWRVVDGNLVLRNGEHVRLAGEP